MYYFFAIKNWVKTTTIYNIIESRINTFSDENGQTFFEFILLLAILMLLSWTFLYSFNNGLTGFWKAMITIITYPSEDIDKISFD